MYLLVIVLRTLYPFLFYASLVLICSSAVHKSANICHACSVVQLFSLKLTNIVNKNFLHACRRVVRVRACRTTGRLGRHVSRSDYNIKYSSVSKRLQLCLMLIAVNTSAVLLCGPFMSIGPYSSPGMTSNHTHLSRETGLGCTFCEKGRKTHRHFLVENNKHGLEVVDSAHVFDRTPGAIPNSCHTVPNSMQCQRRRVLANPFFTPWGQKESAAKDNFNRRWNNSGKNLSWALKGRYTQKWKFHPRLVFPHNKVCKKANVDPPLLLTAPDVTADLRLCNHLWWS